MTMTQHACGGAVATTSAGRSLRARSSATYGSTAAAGKTTVKNATVAMPTNRRSSTALTTTCATNATYAHTSKKGLASFVERASGPQMKKDLIPFRVGMTVKVGVTVKEGNKTRVQPYEGVVIAIHRAGVATTVTVRKSLQGFGVERIFPVHSPLCTFEEIRGAGKPVVRIRFSSCFFVVFSLVFIFPARGGFFHSSFFAAARRPRDPARMRFLTPYGVGEL
jgi:large subunit ribosomal protein L19